MKESVFNSLTIVTSPSAVDALTAGDNFLWDGDGATAQSKQVGNTALRHRIHYMRRTDDFEYPQGVVKKWVDVFDILESDVSADETKTATRKGISRSEPADAKGLIQGTRDDDDRNKNIKSISDWS